ncbi:MAG TPA: D-amino acid aminotransferase [Povalibacter sp.]|uniref:D-amino acid aminotransferase n=1 Tax=Povalibacter sp. TaxID=1962978 RepID=UPI002C4ADAAA|nr:D-amino acid aminotransferase [Povalibacter sp.]HMN44462.1 D-amino acid aminotransferase [Povalibacter sp.]
MPFPVCYLNGEFLALQEARISPLDRGFLFGDSVYEVLPVFDGRMFRFREHFDRLARSLREIRMASPHSHEEWLVLLEQLIERNGGRNMYLYVQVTRGTEFGRSHEFPANVRPTVFALASLLPVFTAEQLEKGLSAMTVEDFRWGRCDIKSTALLANVLMKQQAIDAGAQEALIVRDGEVLEGSSTSVFIVRDGVLVTPANSHRILPGTTRDTALELATGMIPIEIRSIAVDELSSADEVWIASATRDVLPVTRIDGRPVGSGKPGPLWHKVSAAFGQMRQRLAGTPAL